MQQGVFFKEKLAVAKIYAYVVNDEEQPKMPKNDQNEEKGVFFKDKFQKIGEEAVDEETIYAYVAKDEN